jgi:serine/threonine-protein kinase
LRDFQHEFKILQKLRGCAGICQLVENNKKGNYAAIEYFQGYSLRKRIEDMETQPTLIEKRHIFTQILKTMSFMHERGILHGDFHYSNILLNDDLTVKVIDFDLALHISERNKVGLMRGGIKNFLPPERIEMNAFEIFNDPPDFPAEVFQMGVIGYFLFFEKLPFEGDTWKQMAKAIIHDEPDYTRVDIPTNITLFLKKSLEKKPENRFNSAIEMYQNWLRIDD